MRKFIALVALLSGIAGADTTEQETFGQADAPLAAEVLGMQVHTSDPEEMRYVILRELTDRYAADNEIEVQQAEIDAYVEAMSRRLEEDRKQREVRREEAAAKLASRKNLPDAERQALGRELEMLNDLLDTGSTKDAAEDKAAREQVAAAFIRQWKINRALYKQYGGRIIFQQGGPEPLDAYRQFLEQQEQGGAFRIVDKSFEPVFWRYYTNDTIHSFYPEGSKEEAEVLETPWWLREDAKGAQ